MRAAFDAADYPQVATIALESYGDEILGFLVARLRSRSDAAEVFSMWSEDVWSSLDGFRWRCSMRGWLYTLARNAANRYTNTAASQRDRHVTLDDHPVLAELVDRVRTRTLAHLKTEVKSRMRVLREQLPVEDQTLLMLRVDRGLPYRDLALVMLDGDDREVDDAALQVLVARLRKRFEAAKARLRALAVSDGLLKD